MFIDQLPIHQRQATIFLIMTTILALLIIASGVLFFRSTSPKRIEASLETNHHNTLGQEKSAIQITFFVNYTEPESLSANQILAQLYHQYSKDLYIVYKYFPTVKNNRSHLAAQAVECIGRQGQFYGMHQLVLQNQAQWLNIEKDDDLIEYFIELSSQIQGVDTDVFADELKNERYREAIDIDQQDGFVLDFRKAPAIYIQTKQILPLSQSNLEEAFKQSLKD